MAQTFTLESLRLGINKLFADEKLEADTRLVQVDANGDLHFIAMVHTATLTLDAITKSIDVNGSAVMPLKFIGGHLNTSDVNTFYFTFVVTKDALDGGGGLCG